MSLGSSPGSQGPTADSPRGGAVRVMAAAVAVGAVLADGSIITLALPEILRD